MINIISRPINKFIMHRPIDLHFAIIYMLQVFTFQNKIFEGPTSNSCEASDLNDFIKHISFGEQ